MLSVIFLAIPNNIIVSNYEDACKKKACKFFIPFLHISLSVYSEK